MQSGRDVNVNNGVVRANGKNLSMRSGRTINITNSSQLKALLDETTLMQLVAQKDINLDLAMLDSSGMIELQATTGNITMNQVTSCSDVFKATTLSPNGWITIGNSTIKAGTMLELYGGSGSGGVKFVANSTLDSPLVNIRGRTVEVVNGVIVEVPKGNLNINYNTTNHLYNRSDVPETVVPNKGRFNVGGGGVNQ
jgi:hypothetical protein